MASGKLHTRVNLLSTRPLEPALIEQAGEHNIGMECLSFIRTEPVKDPIVANEIRQHINERRTVVFTSMNAAEAVAGYLGGNIPSWKIYCIGTATKEVVDRKFQGSEFLPAVYNASSLAETIIHDGEKDIIFFCGDMRRDELPGILAAHHVSLRELVVYRTFFTPHKIEKDYNGILFFSPSAVESFFSGNTIANDIMLFAIGTTTADCIRRFSGNTVIISDRPGKRNLVEKAIAYFVKLKISDEHTKE